MPGVSISRRETGHSGMTKYQIEDGARHSLRVSGAERWSGERSWINVDWDQLALFVGVPSRERSRLLAFPPARVLGSGLARVAGTSLAKGLKITG